MFLTYDGALSTDLIDGRTAWQIVERHGQTPWFHISFLTKKDKKGFACVILAADIHELAQVLDLPEDNGGVVNVQVVLPSWMTGKSAWCMRQLVEVKCTRDRDGVPVTYYMVAGGRTYSERTNDAVLMHFPDGPHVIYNEASLWQSQASG